MSERKRKIFTGAQKAKVALEAVRGMETINEIAQENAVHPTQVSQWKKRDKVRTPDRLCRAKGDAQQSRTTRLTAASYRLAHVIALAS